MNVSLDVEYLSCPITQEIFKDPVVADDQILYERDAIEDWLCNNKISPTTREPISKILTSCAFMQKLVELTINLYPELKEQQYNVPDMDRVAILISQKRLSSLKRYTKFDIVALRQNNSINTLLERHDDETLKYIFDHSDNLECRLNGRELIHVVCLYGTPSIVRYLIDKGINLEGNDDDSWRVIHYACRYSKPEIVKLVIDKGVNLEAECSRKWRPIHFICRYSTPDLIKYIIDKGVDLEATSDIGWRPIHFICKYSTPEMIMYIIDKGVNLEAEISDGWRPLHLICYHSNAATIKHILKKGVDLTTRVKKIDKEVVDYNYIDLLERNEKISEEEYDDIMIMLTTLTSN